MCRSFTEGGLLGKPEQRGKQSRAENETPQRSGFRRCPASLSLIPRGALATSQKFSYSEAGGLDCETPTSIGYWPAVTPQQLGTGASAWEEELGWGTRSICCDVSPYFCFLASVLPPDQCPGFPLGNAYHRAPPTPWALTHPSSVLGL